MNKKNPIARVLQFFTSKRFKDKTKYTRKVKHVQKDINGDSDSSSDNTYDVDIDTSVSSH